MGLEHFHCGESKLMPPLGEPITKDDSGFYSEDDKILAAKLDPEHLYQVTLDGKVHRVTFERWHGAHALFYSFRDDWRFAVYIDHLREHVKRVKLDDLDDQDSCAASIRGVKK
jgi:hypothetical protein